MITQEPHELEAYRVAINSVYGLKPNPNILKSLQETKFYEDFVASMYPQSTLLERGNRMFNKEKQKPEDIKLNNISSEVQIQLNERIKGYGGHTMIIPEYDVFEEQLKQMNLQYGRSPCIYEKMNTLDMKKERREGLDAYSTNQLKREIQRRKARAKAKGGYHN